MERLAKLVTDALGPEWIIGSLGQCIELADVGQSTTNGWRCHLLHLGNGPYISRVQGPTPELAVIFAIGEVREAIRYHAKVQVQP